MRNLIISMHTSLDGFVAGPNGEMDWIKVDAELFEYAGKLTDEADTALYGRVTYQMMDGYWPTAGDSPNASKHDKQHSEWYNTVPKIVLSKTLDGNGLSNTTVLSGNLAEEITALKKKSGKSILIFGSPSAVHSLMKDGLIDEFWLFVNPVVLGKGIPMFKNVDQKLELTLVESKQLSSGVVGLHYLKK